MREKTGPEVEKLLLTQGHSNQIHRIAQIMTCRYTREFLLVFLKHSHWVPKASFSFLIIYIHLCLEAMPFRKHSLNIVRCRDALLYIMAKIGINY